MTHVRARQESKWSVPPEIHSFFLHHMVCCRDFGRKIPAVGCVDDVLNGYFQSAYIVPGLHSTVIPIVDRDETNAQQWKNALHIIACFDIIAGKPGKVLYDNCFHLAILRVLQTRMRGAPVMNSPQTLREWLRLYCASLEHEVFLALYLDAHHALIGTEQLFRGTLTQTSVYPRELVKAALARNAAAGAVAHNHPTGNAAPTLVSWNKPPLPRRRPALMERYTARSPPKARLFADTT